MRVKLKSPLAGVFASTLLVMVLLVLPAGGWFLRLGYDLLCPASIASPPNDAIVVSMDDASYHALDQNTDEQWDRGLHAQLLEKLSADAARLVVLDVLFLSGRIPESDDRLAEAIKTNGMVMLASKLADISTGSAQGNKPVDLLPLFETNALRWGVANIDPDRIKRRNYLGTALCPSLPWVVFEELQKGHSSPSISQSMELWIRWYGPPRRGVLTMSYSDALTQPMGYFKGKIVFIGSGVTTPGRGGHLDRKATPLGMCDGVEIIATCTMNLVEGIGIKRASMWTEVGLALLVGVAFYWIQSVNRLVGGLSMLGMAVLVFLLAVYAFAEQNSLLNWMPLVFVQIPILTGAFLTRKFRPQPVGQPAQSGSSADEPDLAVSEAPKVIGFPELIKASGYQLGRKVGSGGFGTVFLCEDSLSRKLVAKLIEKSASQQDSQFKQEFKSLKEYVKVCGGHLHLINILHADVEPTGAYYFYVIQRADSATDGALDDASYAAKDLKFVLEHQKLGSGQVLQYAVALAGALQFLHEKHLVHCDIKPANIVFMDGRPILADPGLVSRVDQTTQKAGTLKYMGSHHGKPRGDLQSLGKVLGEVLEATIQDPLADKIRAIATKAASEDDVNYYATASAMLIDLEQFKTSATSPKD